MLVDALIAADPVLKMTERIHDPREFVKMDDTLLKQIENYSMLHPHFQDTDDFAPVNASQKIITRYVSCGCQCDCILLLCDYRRPVTRCVSCDYCCD